MVQTLKTAVNSRAKLRTTPAPSTNGKSRVSSVSSDFPKCTGNSTGSSVSSESSDFQRCGGIVGEVAQYLARFMVLPPETILAISAWVAASWLADVWDRFPHLAITSATKRCGKSTLFELLAHVLYRPINTINASSAAIYRSIKEDDRPSLLMDEAQYIERHDSEGAKLINELLCGSYSKKATVLRCYGEGHEPKEFRNRSRRNQAGARTPTSVNLSDVMKEAPSGNGQVLSGASCGADWPLK